MTLATSLRKTASKLMGKFGGTATIRKEWNAGAAAAWGFVSREHVQRAMDGYVRARDEQGRYLPDDPTTADVNEAWVKA